MQWQRRPAQVIFHSVSARQRDLRTCLQGASSIPRVTFYSVSARQRDLRTCLQGASSIPRISTSVSEK